MTSTLLSPLDQYMPKLSTTIILAFETQQPSTAISRLKAGLQRLNQRLPYLKGRVFVTEAEDGRGRLALKWCPTDQNVELVEANAAGLSLPGMSFQKLKGERAPLHYFHASLSPLPSVTDLKSHAHAPVFAANYTLLSGGVVLALSIQHGVMDGSGMSELITFWAALSRFDDTDALQCPTPDPEEPLYRDRLLRLAIGQGQDQCGETRLNSTRSTDHPFSTVFSRHPEFGLLSDLMAAGGPPGWPWPSPVGSSKVFTFHGPKLEGLKTTLRAREASPEWVTTNTVLCALIWSCITRVRAARRDEGLGAPESKLGFAVDGRKRLSSGETFSKRPFLGNFNIYGLAEVATSSLMVKPVTPFDVFSLAPAARAIADAVKKITPEHIANVIELVDKAPDMQDIIPGWNAIHAADLSITSWANMPLYDCDFGTGLGKPAFIRVPEVETDGLVIILPRKRKRGGDPDTSLESVEASEGIEVVVAMYSEDMLALERDAVWTSYLV